jgi:hypothetical protein
VKPCDYEDTELKSAQNATIRETRDWRPQLRELIGKACGSFSMKILQMLPPGWYWNHYRGTTIITNAANVMLPVRW